MEIVHLSLGSNLGNRLETLALAIKKIGESCGSILSISPVYQSEPIGFKSDDQFLNLCLKLQTAMGPEELLLETQKIEIELGRSKKTETNYTSREIDIDLILYGQQRVKTDKLEIPHAHFRTRRFVLKPLNDIATGTIDPVTGKSILELLSICEDTSQISVFENQLNLNE